jgi:hypothetical protein
VRGGERRAVWTQWEADEGGAKIRCCSRGEERAGEGCDTALAYTSGSRMESAPVPSAGVAFADPASVALMTATKHLINFKSNNHWEREPALCCMTFVMIVLKTVSSIHVRIYVYTVSTEGFKSMIHLRLTPSSICDAHTRTHTHTPQSPIALQNASVY